MKLRCWQLKNPTLATLAFLALVTPSVAEDRWQSGFGQGIHEAYVEKGPGNQIYVACTAGAARPSTSISFMLAGDGPPDNSLVTLTFDNETPFDIGVGEHGVLRSDCHACAASFDYVLERLKTRQSVHVRFEDGLSTTFPLADASTSIGDECTADFWEAY